MLSSQMNNKQRIRLFIWLTIVLCFWVWVIYKNQQLGIEQIASFLKRFQRFIIIAYLIFCSLRAFTLIPNMTVLLVGTLVISNPWALLVTSLIGFVISSSLIYFFGEDTGMDKILLAKYPDKVEKIKLSTDRYGAPIIFLWGFLPAIPADLISFILGIIKFNYWRFILPHTLSHIVTYSIIIFGSKSLWTLLGISI